MTDVFWKVLVIALSSMEKKNFGRRVREGCRFKVRAVRGFVNGNNSVHKRVFLLKAVGSVELRIIKTAKFIRYSWTGGPCVDRIVYRRIQTGFLQLRQ